MSWDMGLQLERYERRTEEARQAFREQTRQQQLLNLPADVRAQVENHRLLTQAVPAGPAYQESRFAERMAFTVIGVLVLIWLSVTVMVWIG